ncbi:hypothetical protein QA584_12670 [Anaerocolumna sp. AGMB13025]|uniref:hypothetical protein n=1 Tax=Anaerocolumna sp. AGMB13025 TaxID=3039116 RepID=UPI00241D05F5|nr:hypothetical protein [Anaerocolumna sp. AGMB13025]WFR59893.1 hypothetical protein QA584_12670 [Anaerocolumna sp. AGMB13025]
MDKYINMFIKKNTDINEGYSWVMREEVYIPIVRTYLSITKRSHFLLPLLDEITLRLLAEGVNEISEISKILGIDRKLLEITIADLYIKGLIYCSADRCTLQTTGKAALQKLQVIQRKKDILRNIYFDPINRKVLPEFNNLQLINNTNDNDKKVETEYELERIDIFRGNMDVINQIFLEEMDIYNDKTKAEPDELLSIDGIESVSVKFIKIPIDVYVSNSGRDIDILPINKELESIFNDYKTEIIEQIRKHKLFKKDLYSYPVEEKYENPSYTINSKITEGLLKHKKSKWEENELKYFFNKEILENRKLFDDEFDIMLRYLSDCSEKIIVKISHLDEWYNKELLNKILSLVGISKLDKIYYASCKQINKCIKYLERNTPKLKSKIQMELHNDYIGICFDNKYILKGIPENIKVLDEDTYIHKLNFYLECNK